MISPHAMDATAPISPLAAEMWAQCKEDAKRRVYRQHATFRGMQENVPGKPPLELWNLTAPLGEHPVNSTVTPATLDKYLFPETAKYGSTTMPAGVPVDFSAIEKP